MITDEAQSLAGRRYPAGSEGGSRGEMRMVQTAVFGLSGTGCGFGYVQAQGGHRASDIIDQERRQSQTAEGVEQVLCQRTPAAGAHRAAADLHG